MIVLMLALLCVFPNSGISGQVFLGPMCPVQRIDSPCPDRPYQASIAILGMDRHFVTRVRADRDGHFQIALKPGRYILHPESRTIMPHAPEQTVSVDRNTFSTVRIDYDTGIR